jgi:hypothetical protein
MCVGPTQIVCRSHMNIMWVPCGVMIQDATFLGSYEDLAASFEDAQMVLVAYMFIRVIVMHNR